MPRASRAASAWAAILVSWGLFVKHNHPAEQLEPEALQQAKQEDAKLEPDSAAK